MTNSQVYVYLTGGFGNQLFQVAAAKSMNVEKIKLIKNIGRPRIDSHGKPEIFNVNIGPEVEEHELRHNNSFISKVFGYLLRSSVSPTLAEKLILRKLMRLVGSIIINYELGARVQIIYSDNIGYSELKRKKSTVLLIGYFQSYRYLDEARRENLRINQSIFAIREPTPTEISKKQTRLIIHYRLGDYKLEKAFGIVDPDYYIRALESVRQETQVDEVWIFSDEIDSAKKLLGGAIFPNAIWIDPKNHNTESSFELMRQGDVYIIGNSTYSWWAATLSYAEPKVVISPLPWFAKIQEPQFLISPAWKRIETDFTNA
jgi:hypothetical protein